MLFLLFMEEYSQAQTVALSRPKVTFLSSFDSVNSLISRIYPRKHNQDLLNLMSIVNQAYGINRFLGRNFHNPYLKIISVVLKL